ncbi:UDP-glucuronate 4-epimerase [Maribacter sedimenticola]|uniref:UDP-glucuronate 4-epimerase n=1 Tax=Maribacter sedimenticola TaxID=228956 RepID=A0ABY1SJU8_9FLAO|nr:NAD-dependent epimerase/dehydratase family protein [Maribacter sedimenticola]SNR66793.1 UDP-glucuronate 4-epimerase [Maribacter sedimenticola]
MKILITGAAGFIGYHLTQALLHIGYKVVGLDSVNDYYDPNLKYDRLFELGIPKMQAKKWNFEVVNSSGNFKFIRTQLEDMENLQLIFKKEKFDVVCNLAAQAGVRYSIENPKAYIDSNLVGYFNILECCRQFKIKHFIYASSSSVYGIDNEVPFNVSANTDKPVSLYAATKKCNEVMAHSYSHLYKLKTTGLRFFTVYGPWGRPDMAIFLFTKAILKNEEIKIFNQGKLERDFTFIDDVIESMVRIVQSGNISNHLYKIYNIGNNQTVKLMNMVNAIEKSLNLKAIIKMMPMQPGDVFSTLSDSESLSRDYGFKPKTELKLGIEKFVKWYKSYYQ